MRIEQEEGTPDRLVGRRAARPLYTGDEQEARSLAESVRMALRYLEEIGARPPPVTP